MTTPPTPRAFAVVLSLGLLAACSVYPRSLPEVEPELGLRFVQFSQTDVWPVELELTEPAHVSLFSIGGTVEMLSPLVSVSRLEEIYGAWLGPVENDAVLTFRMRHPWPHPDSVPDPFAQAPLPLDSGRHALQEPFAPYVIQEIVNPQPCIYFLLVASSEVPDFSGLFDLEFTRWPRNPEESAERIVRALGIEPDEGGWNAILEQGVCGGRER